MFSADDVRALLTEFEEPELHFIAGRLVPRSRTAVRERHRLLRAQAALKLA
jgi:hypothetical protein